MKATNVTFSIHLESGDAAIVENPQAEILSQLERLKGWVDHAVPTTMDGEDMNLNAACVLFDTNGRKIGSAGVEIVVDDL